jgi:Bacterial protein of unknown function (DUF839)
MRARSWRRATLLPATALSLIAIAPPVSADPLCGSPAAALITLDPSVPAGSCVLPIIDVGDTVGDTFRFEGIPDGIGAMPGSGGAVEVFVNHEQTRVPFDGTADFQMASVSHLTLDANAAVGAASVAIPPSAGFQRFCSATMAGPAEGLDDYLFLTGEEAPEAIEVPPGAPYGPDRAYAPDNLRQSGLVAVLDPVSGAFTAVPGMGRHNHENEMVLPGDWEQIAVYSGDDTFTPPAPASQLYLYLANDEQEIWDDEGTLWAFRATHFNGRKVDAADPLNDANDYSDIGITDGVTDHVRGRFIRVPTKIAKGLTSTPPQDALERWSNTHNVFQFIRVEDSAYDPRVGPGENPVMYFTDTGSGGVVEGSSGQLTAGSGPFDRGRIFRMEFAPDNPRKVVDLSILLDGNFSPNPFSDGVSLRAPDNLGTSDASLMVQEDTTRQVSRVLRYDLEGETWSVVARVKDQDWESSGIVDASEFYGPGTWLLDVQAHDLFVDGPTDPDADGVRRKREGGQLLLLTLPGS